MRYVILLSAVMMQMCLGATYSWSVYVHPLKTLTGLQQGPVQIPFTAFYFSFPLTMMLAGTILPKIGPRMCAMGGGFLFGSGWLIASLGYKNFLFTTMGIGVVSGSRKFTYSQNAAVFSAPSVQGFQSIAGAALGAGWPR